VPTGQKLSSDEGNSQPAKRTLFYHDSRTGTAASIGNNVQAPASFHYPLGSMNCTPHWTAYLSALLVPVVAVMGAIIAYRQWRTAQNKLKLELFERSFAVFDAVRKLIGSIMGSGRAIDQEVFKYRIGTREARWLLDQDIAEYLDKELYDKVIDLQTLHSELEGLPVGPERTANVQKQSEVKKWIYKQYEVLDEKFSKYLQLEH
jgi:hypothetical protein